jgi:hypothetical protein
VNGWEQRVEDRWVRGELLMTKQLEMEVAGKKRNPRQIETQKRWI